MIFDIIRMFTNCMCFGYTSVFTASILIMYIDKMPSDKFLNATIGGFIFSLVIGVFSYKTLDNAIWKKLEHLFFYDSREV